MIRCGLSVLLVLLVFSWASPAGALDHDGSSSEHSHGDPGDAGSGDAPEIPNHGGGFTAPETAGDSGGVRVTRSGQLVQTEPPANPIVPATIREADEADESDDAEEADEPVDDCLQRAPSEYNAAEDLYYTGRCVKRVVCGAERVDDVVSGDIAGEDSTGRYRSFLGEMIGYFGGDSPPADAGLGDAGSVNDFLLAGGLGNESPEEAIPVFYWCAPRHESGVYDPIDIATASFGWDLSYDDVYDIVGVRASLYVELTAILDLYAPEIGLVPPADVGYTFVQWPTWMFLENPLEGAHVYTHNDTDTFRIDLRATLERVEWRFGEELVAECSLDDMMKYDADAHHPIDDLPACNHRFTQLGVQDLTTTIYYKIEERIRDRIVDPLREYSDDPWVDYLGTPTLIDLSATIDDYEIHEIVSVNVPQVTAAGGPETDDTTASIPGS